MMTKEEMDKDGSGHTDKPKKRRGCCLFVLAALGICLLLCILAISIPPSDDQLPTGRFRSTTSEDVMTVTKQIVRIRNGKSTWATLPNLGTGRKLYDKDDLAKAHPQRLQLRGDGQIEYIRAATPPFPEQRLIFVRDE